MKKVTEIQLSSNGMLNWLLQQKTNSLSKDPVFVRQALANHLNVTFNTLDTGKKAYKSNLDVFVEKDYEGCEMSPVLKIREQIKGTEFFNDFIIHSSTSDLKTVCGWSDFDALAIVKQSALEKENFEEFYALCKDIDTEMRRIDALQHHGIHFLHERELYSYPQLYLPKEVLSKGKSLFGKSTIALAPVCSREKEKQRLKNIVSLFKEASESGFLNHHARDEKFLKNNFEDDHTMYQLKYFLCVIMLLPSYWFNLKDIYCQKSESFEMIENFFDDQQLEILHCASEIRKNWKSSSENPNLIPSWVETTLGKNYFERAFTFSSMLWDTV